MRVAVVTNVIPSYREDFYRRLFSHYGQDIQVFCQSSIKGMNLECVHDNYPENINIIRCTGLVRDVIAFQHVPVKRLYDEFDVIFFAGNPRVVSNVLWSSMLRLLGKRVVIWGQYHTANSGVLTKTIRLLWWKLFRNVFLYTDAEKEQYRQTRSDGTVIVGMNNGLDQSDIVQARESFDRADLAAWAESQQLQDRKVILSCARLDAKNRFEIMLEALPDIVRTHPQVLWCVIGGGVEEQRLRSMATELGVEEYIRWLGPIYGEQALAPWFLNAVCLIHPGAIGLSLLHAMGYGLPVVTHDNPLNQMPEFAALTPDLNGVVYEEGDVASMCQQVTRLIEDDELAAALSEQAMRTVDEKYNTRAMSENFIDMVDAAR